MDFKHCVLLMDDSKSNKDKIISIKGGMNRNRPYDDRWNYVNSKVFNLRPEWVQAYIDGEGCFQVTIYDAVSTGKIYTAVKATLEIAQNSHDVSLLKAIVNFFGIGYLKPKFDISCLHASKKSRSVSTAIFNQYNKIIEFVD